MWAGVLRPLGSGPLLLSVVGDSILAGEEVLALQPGQVPCQSLRGPGFFFVLPGPFVA